MKLFVLSDLRLGAACSAWGRHGSKRREELRAAWTCAVDRVLSPEDGADAMLVAGDLFDRPDPDAEDAAAVMQGLERLAEARKPVLLLPGIRDGAFIASAFYNRSFPDGVTAVTWAESRCLHLGIGNETFRVHCRAPVPGCDEAPLVPDDHPEDAAYDIGLAYALPEALASEDPAGPRGLDLLVLGGGSEFESDTVDGVTVVHPGTPVASRPEQTGDRFWCVVEVTREGATVERTSCDIPPVVQVEVAADTHDPGDSGSLAAYLETHHAGHGLVCVRLTGETEAAWDPAALETVADNLPFAVRIEDDSVPTGGPAGERERGLGGRFRREIDVLRRDPDAADETLLARALRLGLKELRRLEECHAD